MPEQPKPVTNLAEAMQRIETLQKQPDNVLDFVERERIASSMDSSASMLQSTHELIMSQKLHQQSKMCSSLVTVESQPWRTLSEADCSSLI
jgi:hypothetical protein